MVNELRGFTLVEVLVALVVLTVGVLALAGSSAMVTRLLGRGRVTTMAAQVANRRLEQWRSVAVSTVSPCAALTSASGSEVHHGVAERWQIVLDGQARLMTVVVTYQLAGGLGSRADTVATVVSCLT